VNYKNFTYMITYLKMNIFIILLLVKINLYLLFYTLVLIIFIFILCRNFSNRNNIGT